MYTKETAAEFQDNEKGELINPELCLTISDYLLVRRILVNRFLSKLRLLYKDLSTQYYLNFKSQSLILAYDYIPSSEISEI